MKFGLKLPTSSFNFEFTRARFTCFESKCFSLFTDIKMPSNQYQLQLSNPEIGILDHDTSGVTGQAYGTTKVILVDRSILSVTKLLLTSRINFCTVKTRIYSKDKYQDFEAEIFYYTPSNKNFLQPEYE